MSPFSKALCVVCRYTAAEINAWPLPDEPSRTRRDALARYAALAPLPDGEPLMRDAVVDGVIARMTTAYPAAAMTTVPAVVAASEMKRRFDLLQDPDDRGRSLVEAAGRWERPAFLDPGDAEPAAGTQRGTATHLVLEHLDLSGPCDAAHIRRRAKQLVDSGILGTAEADAVAVDAIGWFFQTELGRRMCADPGAVQREVMFVTRVAPQQYDPDLAPVDERDVILVRGIIDCLVHGPDGLEIIDYKTDELSADEVVDRAATYAPQLAMYARAVATIWQKPVVAKRLVFLTPRVIHDLS